MIIKILHSQKDLFLNRRTKYADNSLLMFIPSDQIDIIALQALFVFCQGDDIASLFCQRESQLRDINFA